MADTSAAVVLAVVVHTVAAHTAVAHAVAAHTVVAHAVAAHTVVAHTVAVPGIDMIQHISGMNDSTSFDSDNRRPSPSHKLSNIVSCFPSYLMPVINTFNVRFALHE